MAPEHFSPGHVQLVLNWWGGRGGYLLVALSLEWEVRRRTAGRTSTSSGSRRLMLSSGSRAARGAFPGSRGLNSAPRTPLASSRSAILLENWTDRPAKSGGGPATRLPSGVRLRGRRALSRYCVALVWLVEAKKAPCATASRCRPTHSSLLSHIPCDIAKSVYLQLEKN